MITHIRRARVKCALRNPLNCEKESFDFFNILQHSFPSLFNENCLQCNIIFQVTEYLILDQKILPCDHRRIASAPYVLTSATPSEVRTSQVEERTIKHGIPVTLNFSLSIRLRVRSANNEHINNVYRFERNKSIVE